MANIIPIFFRWRDKETDPWIDLPEAPELVSQWELSLGGKPISSGRGFQSQAVQGVVSHWEKEKALLFAAVQDSCQSLEAGKTEATVIKTFQMFAYPSHYPS